ncbi:tryptophan halogenase family protein [Brevundimonas balnearis]|uniref:Tryptophan halogenase family protein n=1 Tax=Brevundimonas balnearis TaxID=1572858 RepID=A0ABV6R1P8_9CAUL
MRQLNRILIVGGGSAGWMTAALLSKLLKGRYEITLVESELIGTVGVGEATIPAIKKYNELLGLDEADFMLATQGTYKMGIQFNDWGHLGESYIHGFGVIGRELEWLRCHHYWLKMNALGRAGPFENFSINTAAALQNRFMRPDPRLPESPLGRIGYAYHFDAGLFARYLRGLAESRGVVRREGRIAGVQLGSDDGFVRSVTLDDGAVLEADLFIDCSGFRGLIIEEALKTGYDDWSRWLPCDRAIAMPCERTEPLLPYTRATARDAGWQWRIPLQHRTGNGCVYASAFIGDDEVEATLRAHLDGAPTGEPNRLRFVTGKRKRVWNRNCVALGLAAGFMEPLESTSLHLIQTGVLRLIRLWPGAGFDPADIAEFNRQTDFEYERIRDFLVLHYKATRRDDTPFWRHCREMAIPDTLQRKIDLWMAHARVVREDEELFAEESWIQVFLGQGWTPRGYDPLVDVLDETEIETFVRNVETTILKCVAVMPEHAAFVAKHVKAAPIEVAPSGPRAAAPVLLRSAG